MQTFALTRRALLSADPAVAVILTPPSSTTTLAVVPIAERAGKLALSVVASAPAVVGPDHLLSCRTTLDWSMNVAPSIEFLVKDKGVKRIAQIGRNDDWGRASIASIEATARDLGAEVVMKDFFESGATDFYGVLTKARSGKPDAVVAAAFIEDGMSLLKQSRELQMEMPLFSLAVIWASPVVLKGPGRMRRGSISRPGPPPPPRRRSRRSWPGSGPPPGGRRCPSPPPPLMPPPCERPDPLSPPASARPCAAWSFRACCKPTASAATPSRMW